jgi:hypothetical protein
VERRERITLEAWRDPVSPRARLVAQKNIAEQLLIARIHMEEGNEELAGQAIGNAIIFMAISCPSWLWQEDTIKLLPCLAEKVPVTEEWYETYVAEPYRRDTS